MQVDPNSGTVVYVNTPRGGELTLDPGREVVARVVAAGSAGGARISLAGQQFDVATDATLRVGDEIRLRVSHADETGVRMAIVTSGAVGDGNAVGGRAAQLLGELARAGVPVSPTLAQAVGTISDQLGGGSAATRAVANLAGRDLVLSPAAAGRVVAALDLAGSLGPSLASLASRSAEIAAALPGGVPSAAALRSLLAPNLAPSELAVARIVQATQGAALGAAVPVATPPASSLAVIQNYVASQVAVNASLDELATQNSLLGGTTLANARAQGPVPGAAPVGLAPAALAAALRGQDTAALGSGASPTRATLLPATIAPATTASQPHAQAAAGSARTNATAAAATGAAAATPTPTSAPAAQAIADLATLATRFAPAVAPSTGAIGTAMSVVGRGMNAVEIAHQAGRVGSAAPGVASIAGAGVSGEPAPLVHALRAFLASPGTEADAARLLRGLQGAEPQLLAASMRALPESQSLQLAGRLLALLPGAGQLTGHSAAELKQGVHAALEQLGRAMQPLQDGSGRDLATLRAALEHVAATDPRSSVAGDAARLLAATDGQQILSRTAAGSDPGYVYFQVPMPDGRGAEVMVRREPGRRQVSFDEFNIAFLLDTEQIGTLMIQLDAHPAGIRADVRTDIAELEPFLRARAEQLVEPLARESRRPVTITTGVFEQEPPTSLLEPRLGLIEPGALEYYA